MLKKKLLLLSILVSIFAIVLLCFTSFWYENKVFENYALADNKYQLDSIAGHIKKTNLYIPFNWVEHPSGQINIITNNLGFREDSETPTKKAENTYRVIITGDSHTDGVVNNSESFANLYEKELNENDTIQKYEVINGGTGFYTFKNFEGFIEKNLYLQPNNYIVTIYLGNDFVEAIFTEHPPTVLESIQRSWYRIRKSFHFFGEDKLIQSQYALQDYFFELNPYQRTAALDIALGSLDQIKATCKKNNIDLQFLILPSKGDFSNPSKSLYFRTELMKYFVNNQIEFIDLLPKLRKVNESLYWNEDLHLNLRGHEEVASILFAEQQLKYSLKDQQ